MRRSKHSDDSRLFFDWLEIAARDLLAARLLMERQQCLEIAGFHCQQAVEKGLKAYIIHASGQLVDGHNVTWLCRQAVRYNPDFGDWMEDCAKMNRLYIETRYPSDEDLHLSGETVERYTPRPSRCMISSASWCTKTAILRTINRKDLWPMNKRILTILTALCLTGALAGCGTGNPGSVPASSQPAPETTVGHHRRRPPPLRRHSLRGISTYSPGRIP